MTTISVSALPPSVSLQMALGLLVHLPHISEVEKGVEFFYEGPSGVPRDRGKTLRQSLEQALRKETIGLLPYMSAMQADPSAFVLRPSELHPTGAALTSMPTRWRGRCWNEDCFPSTGPRGSL